MNTLILTPSTKLHPLHLNPRRKSVSSLPRHNHFHGGATTQASFVSEPSLRDVVRDSGNPQRSVLRNDDDCIWLWFLLIHLLDHIFFK